LIDGRAARVLLHVVLVGGGVTAVAFALLANWEGVGAAGGRLSELQPGWLLAAGVVWTSALWLQALRWRALMPPPWRPDNGRLGWIMCGANVLHLALPGAVADLVSALVVRRVQEVPVAVGLASGFMARLVALGVLGGTSIALYPLVAARLPAGLGRQVGVGTLLLGGVAVAVGVLARRPDLLVRGATWAASLLGRRGERLAARAAWWARCFAQVGTLPGRHWAESTAWGLLNVGVLSVATWLSLRSIGVTADLLGVVYLCAVLATASVAALVFPSGLGPVDALAVLLLTPLASVPVPDAVLGAAALRWAQLLSMLLSLPPMLWVLARLPEGVREAVEAELE
jgi:hypothetical protein